MKYADVEAGAAGAIAQLNAAISLDRRLAETNELVEGMVANREGVYRDLHDLTAVTGREGLGLDSNAPVAYLIGHTVTGPLAEREDEPVVRPVYAGIRTTGGFVTLMAGVTRVSERLVISTYLGVFDHEKAAMPHATPLFLANSATREVVSTAHGVAMTKPNPEVYELRELVAPSGDEAEESDGIEPNHNAVPPTMSIKRDIGMLVAYKAVLSDQTGKMRETFSMIVRPSGLTEATTA